MLFLKIGVILRLLSDESFAMVLFLEKWSVLYTDIQWISLIITGFFTLILLFYYGYYYSRVAFYREGKKPLNQTFPPVSVVICAKDEYENLKKNLPLILKQDYPNFEVVLVNDFSQDDSYFLLKELQEKHAHFNVIHLRENVNFFKGKKLALALGIKAAKNEWVLLTDADCAPASNQWIKNMAACFDNQTQIVLGYGGYDKRPGFLSKLIRFDTLQIALQYMGFALGGKPFMGVGRNLAYRKDLFFRQGGFTSHYKINSGDDDLFVNKAATKANTRVALHPDSFTYSAPKTTFRSWFLQKKRHLSTGVYYKFADKIKLGLLAVSNTFFYIAFLVSLYVAQSSQALMIAWGIFAIKMFSLILFHYYACKRFNEKKLFLYSPIFDLIFVLLNPVFALSNLVYRKNKWK